MKDPRKATNWSELTREDRVLWLHAFHAWLGRGTVN